MTKPSNMLMAAAKDARPWIPGQDETAEESYSKLENGKSGPTIQPDTEVSAPQTSGTFCTTKLAEMPGETLLDEPALAGLLEVSPRTIRRMVYRGQLPAGIKLGGRRVWLVNKLIEYLNEEGERMAGAAKQTAIRFRNMG